MTDKRVFVNDIRLAGAVPPQNANIILYAVDAQKYLRFVCTRSTLSIYNSVGFIILVYYKINDNSDDNPTVRGPSIWYSEISRREKPDSLNIKLTDGIIMFRFNILTSSTAYFAYPLSSDRIILYTQN